MSAISGLNKNYSNDDLQEKEMSQGNSRVPKSTWGLMSVVLITFLLGGCANTQFVEDQVKTPGYDETQSAKLYAKLQEVDGEWRFTTLSNSMLRWRETPGYNVRLGDYRANHQPEFDFCWRGFFGITRGNCDVRAQHRFDTGNIIAPIFWPFTTLVAVFSPLQDELYFPFLFSQVFDWEAYMDRVEEAKDAENYDDRFTEIYSQYVYAKSLSARSRMPRGSIREVREQAEQHRNEVVKNIAESVRDEIKVDIKDRSGLVDEQPLENTLKDGIYVDVTSIEPLPEFVRYDFEPNKRGPKLDSVFKSANSLSILSDNIDDYVSKTEIIKRQNEEAKEKNIQLKLRVDQENKDALEQYKRTLNDRDAIVSVKALDGFRSALEGYNYSVSFAGETELHLPLKTKVQGGALPSNSRTIVLEIDSVVKKGVMPTGYSNRDENISIVMNGRHIELKNKTDRFVTIDAVSLYHKDIILTKGGTNFEYFIELPPNGTRTINIGLFDIERLDRDYWQLTKKKAIAKNFDFGFAVKYRITESGSPKTLFKTTAYNLYDLIQ